ncbi:LysE family translocator [Cellulosimicrobium protaetiae]|uniref:LysE family translocator n=1 Tax=Cellulosimicrobium protaetiae TaxID=2587808 RepID=A0A6M5UJN4_9MICO|nr:LysE family translocator [Cellulosimicrobium protaetiae]QJW37513.1 LysE family translocator [Cellulosimicrobium protaetiae]
MTVPEALLAFAAVAGVLTIVPGLDTALVLRSTVTRSRGHGVAALLGIQAGTLVWGVAAAAGAAALLAASRVAYQVLTVAGAGYLVWLGAALLWSSFRRRPEGDGVAVPPPVGGRGRDFLMGLTTNLLNPKVGVFYVATIPQFVPEGVNPLAMGASLAGVHCVLGSAWLTGVVLAAGSVGPRLRGSGAVRWVDRVTGGVLVVLGARLAATTRL